MERTEPYVAELSTRRTPLDYAQINRVLPFDTIVERLNGSGNMLTVPHHPIFRHTYPSGPSLNPHPTSPKRLQTPAPQSVPVTQERFP